MVSRAPGHSNGIVMHKFMTGIVLATALGTAGCGYTPEQRAGSGALIGAGTGAALGSALGRGPGAVIAGSLLGAGAGAVIGANTRPPPPPPPVPPVVVYAPPPPPPGRCVEFATDIYGRTYCRARVVPTY